MVALKTLIIHLVAAARPNFMKIAPLYHAMKKETWCRPMVVHTGQHYDANMSDAFFRDLGLPKPDFHLGVGSGNHGETTGQVMIAYEKIAITHRPDWIVVVGDVNPTAACALVGTKLGIPVVHLEAGLRSRDRRMPEEINRLVTDAIADVLWTPSPDADANLRAENVELERITRIGNIMIDSYELMRPAIEAFDALSSLGLEPRRYGIVTLHRPSNVDTRERLEQIVHLLQDISRVLPLVFPLHPRTRARLRGFGLMSALEQSRQIRLLEPMRYIEFMGLARQARFALTDSGGIQEETTYLGIPCLTLRENTERPITLSEGTNRLCCVGDVRGAINDILDDRWPTGRRPELWDGKAAHRAVTDLLRRAGIEESTKG